MESQKIDVNIPLVDENFLPLPESEPFAKLLSDESLHYDFHIYVDSKEMIPTALYMSMSKRINVDCHAHIGTFDGNYYIYSFLSNSAFSSVEMEGLNNA